MAMMAGAPEEIGMAALNGGELKVLSERSLARASESLSELLGHGVRLTVTSVETIGLDALPGRTAEEHRDRLGALTFEIQGDTGGWLLILFPLATIFRMLNTLLGSQEQPRGLTSLEQSAFQEIGNILASSFLSELGRLTGQRYLPSPPAMHFEGVPRLMSEMHVALARLGPEVAIVQGLFEDPVRQIHGRFFILPDLAALNPGRPGGPGSKT
jgi:chemotaxis protein CheC